MRISSRPLEAMLSKLRNQSTGFNKQMELKASSYRLKPWQLEFPADIYSASTKTFLLGQLDPADVAEQAPTGHNRAWMYVTTADNQNYEKPADFSGLIRLGLDFNLEWTCSASSQNLESPSLLLEDVVSEVVQMSSVNWGTDIVYNGAFSCQRSTVDQTANGSGLSLRQMVMFRFVFQLTD